MLTQQDIVNKVYQYYIIEGNPPGYDSFIKNCTYYGKDGERCAVSVCLPDTIDPKSLPQAGVEALVDGDFDGDFDDFELSDELKKHWAPAVYERNDTIDTGMFISRIQMTHDNAALGSYCEDEEEIESFKSGFEHRLRNVCIDHGLTYPGDA